MAFGLEEFVKELSDSGIVVQAGELRAAEGASQVQLHGTFRIHGADHEMTVPVEVEAAGGRYTATARFQVPYVKWGMKNASTFILRVSDKVDLTVRTVLTTPAPGSLAKPTGRT